MKSTGKTKKGQLSKRKIFDAALYLIKTKGYESTTLVDICEAAGIANGSFYHYFSSKQDILIGYIKQEGSDLLNYYDSLKKDSYFDVLQKIVKYQISYFIIKGHEFVSTYYAIMLQSKNSFFDFENFAIRKILIDCFENGQKNGEFSKSFTAKYMSDLAFSILYTTTTSWCLDEGDFDLHEDIREKFMIFTEVFKA